MARTPTIKRDLRLFCPLRKPAWRWLEACALMEAGQKPHPDDDAGIKEALRFQRARALADTPTKRARLRRRWSALSDALLLHQCDDPRRWELEARLLAGQSIQEAGLRIGLDESTATAYERYFFHIADRLDSLTWLLAQAVGIWDPQQNPPDEGTIWRYMGLAGGPLLVDLLAADYLGRPEPVYPNRHELAQKARFLAREYAADKWSLVAADVHRVKEGLALFHDSLMKAIQDGDQMLALHIKTLRMATRLSPMPELEQYLPQPDTQPCLDPSSRPTNVTTL